MAFEGWQGDFVGFFTGLRLDNSKAYWERHKPFYLDQVRGPMVALLEELKPEFGEYKLFRPYRDTRFSADKTPYKTNIAATAAAGGYVSLDAGGLTVGGGRYHLEPAAVRRLRQAVDDRRHGPRGMALVEALEAGGYAIGGEDLKRVPRPFPPDHPRARLLRHKGLIAYRHYPLAPMLATRPVLDVVSRDWRAIWPLQEWLAQALD